MTKNSSYKEREKRHAEIMARVQESYPMGNSGDQDAMWRSLTTSTQRDLNPVTQRRMQQIAFYLFDTNPMGHRIIEIIRDFVIGDGFTFSAEDPKVYAVIDKFWNDPENDLNCVMDENVLELSLFGENCFPVWVNPIDGAVKLGYIDPSWIVKVTKDTKNPRWNDTVVWRKPGMRKEREGNIVRIDDNPKSETYGLLMGDLFYFPINKPINATRGRSDLLSLADWLDGHDQFLFARLERAFLLNTFIWDVTAEGLDKEGLEAFVKSIPTPKPGSIRAHNEKVTWQAISPQLESQDASNEAKLFKGQILGGAGFPSHWFGDGEKTTRATAMEMGLPTLKKLKARQKKVKYQYRNICQFVIDQAILAGTLPKDVDKSFTIITPPIISKDDRSLAQTIGGFVDGLVKARDQKWITDNEAQKSFQLMVSQMGVGEMPDYAQEDDGEEDDSSEEEASPALPSQNNGNGRNNGKPIQDAPSKNNGRKRKQ
jgi:hypothetical protein